MAPRRPELTLDTRPQDTGGGNSKEGDLDSTSRIYRMAYGKVYPLYVAKAERKGRTRGEVDRVITWLTGYDQAALDALAASPTDFEAVFQQAPCVHPNATKITGVICGVRVEDIADPVVQKVRYLDKLIDELAQGRPLEKILRP